MTMIAEKCIPALLGKRYIACSTGILTLKNGNTIKTIHFDTGEIVFATSNLKEERLGEKLVEKGHLSLEQLSKASELMEQYQMRLDQILVKMNFVSDLEFRVFFTQHISEIIYSTFTWQNFTYEFKHDRLPEYDFRVSLSSIQILIEGMRLLEDIFLIKEWIPSLDTPVQFIEEPKILLSTLSFLPQEAKLVSYLEQNIGCTIRKLLELDSISESVIIKTVAAFLQTGVLILGSSRKENFANSFDTKFVLDYCVLVEAKVSTIKANASKYDLLEVSTNATAVEIIDGYTRLVKKFHPDSQAQLNEYGLSLRAELELIFSELTQAVQLLSNPQTKETYDNKLGLNQRKQTSFPTNTTSNSTSTYQNNLASNKRQEVAMQFFYDLESKLNAIRQGATYYQILEVDWNVSTEMVLDSYRRLSERFNLKKQEELASFGIDVRPQIIEVAAAMRKAAEVLSNNIEKANYNQELGFQLRRQVNPNSPNVNNQSQSSNNSNSPFSNLPNSSTQGLSKTTGSFPQISNNSTGSYQATKNPSTLAMPTANNNLNPNSTYRVPPVPTQHIVGNASSTQPTAYNKNTSSNPMLPTSPPNSTSSANSANLSNSDLVRKELSLNLPKNKQELNEPKLNTSETAKYQLPKSNAPNLTPSNRIPTAIDFYMRGVEFYGKKQYEQAISVLRKAVALAPDDSEYWVQLGRAYSRLADNERQAESAYQEALELSPNNCDYLTELGLFYQNLGIIDQAEEQFRNALEINPVHSGARKALANLPKNENKGKSGLLKFISKVINIDEK